MKNIRVVFLLTFLLTFNVLFSQTSSISLKALPPSIISFVDKYFSDYFLFRAMRQSSIYTVIFREGIKANFSLDGEWVSVSGSGKTIPTNFIDDKVVSAVKEKYPDVDMVYIDRKSKGYNIRLKNRVNLFVDFDGNIIKSDRDY